MLTGLKGKISNDICTLKESGSPITIISRRNDTELRTLEEDSYAGKVR